MSNTKHTPGPWHTETNKAGDYTQVKAHPNKFICECDGREKPYENEANAKLIAAAPELLEAATKMMGIAALMLPYCQDNETKELFKKHFHTCQEVIKKVIE